VTDVASEATKTKYDGEFSAQKHQEKTTTDEPEQPDESVDNSISELIEFDEQKLEQQEYPDVVVDDSEHPMVLDENQAVATTSMTTVDTRKVEKSLRLDWQLDLVRPASPRTSHGTTVGTELHGTIGSHLYHPRYGENPPCLNLDVGDDYMEGEATTKKNDGERNAKSIRTTNDGELHAESIGTTNDGELHAESIGTTNDGELHAESIGTTNDGELHAEKHTVGTRAPGASNLARLKKQVIGA
jgi:hypothetical protein